MTQASEGFSVALSTVRREVEAALRGNAYYLAAQQVQEIAETAQVRPAEPGPACGFARALLALRSAAHADFTGNAFYTVSGEVERLAFMAERAGLEISAPAPEAEEPARAAQPALSSMNGARSMDDLAAASRARLEEIAASVGVALAPPMHAFREESGVAANEATPSVSIPDLAEPPQLVAETPALAPETTIRETQEAETLADGELERRSSEPCGMPAIESGRMETLQAASLSPDPVSGAADAHPQVDLGSPHSPAGAGGTAKPDERAPAAEEAAIASAPQPPAQQDAPAATSASADINPAAGRERPPAEKIEAMQRQQKSLFTLWLDVVFGRKRADGRRED